MTNKEKIQKIINAYARNEHTIESIIIEILHFLKDKEAQEAQQDDEIKVGDVVYWLGYRKIRRGRVDDIKAKNTLYVVTENGNYCVKNEEAFKTEEELIESLRGWDENE